MPNILKMISKCTFYASLVYILWSLQSKKLQYWIRSINLNILEISSFGGEVSTTNRRDKSSTKFKRVSNRWSLSAQCATMCTSSYLWCPKWTKKFWEINNKARMILMATCQYHGILCWKQSCGNFSN